MQYIRNLNAHSYKFVKQTYSSLYLQMQDTTAGDFSHRFLVFLQKIFASERRLATVFSEKNPKTKQDSTYKQFILYIYIHIDIS